MADVHLYNPTSEDFTVTYDVEGNNKPSSFTVPAKEIKTFSNKIGTHVRKHLADHIVNKRNLLGGRASEEVYKDVFKEIEVKI